MLDTDHRFTHNSSYQVLIAFFAGGHFAAQVLVGDDTNRVPPAVDDYDGAYVVVTHHLGRFHNSYRSFADDGFPQFRDGLELQQPLLG